MKTTQDFKNMKFINYLIERALQSWMLSNPAEVEAWLKRYDFEDGKYVVHSDGVADVDGYVGLNKHHLRFVNSGLCIPIQFGKVKAFSVSRCHLSTFLGAPHEVEAHASFEYNLAASLDGLPAIVGGTLALSNNKNITSLSNISTIIKSIGKDLVIPGTATKGMINVLMINNLQKITVSNNEASLVTGPKKQAMDIINKHLAGDKDMLDCQEELRTAGLREFGKL